jgi:hypothetical protein
MRGAGSAIPCDLNITIIHFRQSDLAPPFCPNASLVGAANHGPHLVAGSQQRVRDNATNLSRNSCDRKSPALALCFHLSTLDG